jgi:hypothetical protein
MLKYKIQSIRLIKTCGFFHSELTLLSSLQLQQAQQFILRSYCLPKTLSAYFLGIEGLICQTKADFQWLLMS